ncbi:MAG: hypothetical protein KAS30_04990 [Candidatus Diapherotrites archaeon]|nr:hypothetical protein [Candidatus Diapherotrites archaeon]
MRKNTSFTKTFLLDSLEVEILQSILNHPPFVNLQTIFAENNRNKSFRSAIEKLQERGLITQSTTAFVHLPNTLDTFFSITKGIGEKLSKGEIEITTQLMNYELNKIIQKLKGKIIIINIDSDDSENSTQILKGKTYPVERQVCFDTSGSLDGLSDKNKAEVEEFREILFKSYLSKGYSINFK